MLLLSPLFGVTISILPVIGVCTAQYISKPHHHHHRHIAAPLIDREAKSNSTDVQTNVAKVAPEQPMNEDLSWRKADPVDFQKWWLITDTVYPHEAPEKNYNRTTSNFEDLQDDWRDRMGKGVPMFVTRKIDFHSSSQPFYYMFPGGPGGDKTQKEVFDLGMLEPFASYHFAQDIKECCAAGHGHVVDIGGTYGWYSLLSASLGCKVDTFEPVPWYQSLLNYNKNALNANTLSSKITMHSDVFLGSSPGKQRTMVVPTLADGHLNNVYGVTEQTCHQGPECINVETTTLDVVMNQSLDETQSCAFRVDAEGFEPDIFEGAQDILTRKQPKIIVLELSPGMQGRYSRRDEQNIAMFDALVYRGYIPHLLTSDVIRNNNLNVARGNMNAKRWKERPTAELMTKCGYSCIMYLKRPW